jgi:hypothetical protein
VARKTDLRELLMKALRDTIRLLLKEQMINEAVYVNPVKSGSVNQEEYDSTVEMLLAQLREEVSSSSQTTNSHRRPSDSRTKVLAFRLGNFSFTSNVTNTFLMDYDGVIPGSKIFEIMYISDFNHILFKDNISYLIKHEIILGNDAIVNLLFTDTKSTPSESDLKKHYAMQKDLINAKSEVDRSKHYHLLAEKVLDTMLEYTDAFVKEYVKTQRQNVEFEDTPMEKYGKESFLDRLKNK